MRKWLKISKSDPAFKRTETALESLGRGELIDWLTVSFTYVKSAITKSMNKIAECYGPVQSANTNGSPKYS